MQFAALGSASLQRERASLPSTESSVPQQSLSHLTEVINCAHRLKLHPSNGTAPVRSILGVRQQDNTAACNRLSWEDNASLGETWKRM